MKDGFNLIDFYNKFKTEEDCILYFEKMRWGDNIVSPYTGGNAYKYKTRNLYKCKDTGKQFSVRTGTIFEESLLPLQKWFLAIYILHSLKKGISSIQLSKYIGVTQKTAWFMLQRIRYAVEHEAFKAPLSGTIEIDETYMGGKKQGKRGRGASGKTPVVGLVERGGEVRCETVENVKAKTITPLIKEHTSRNSTLMTDEFPIYNKVERMGYEHYVVNHGRKEYVNGSIHTNTIEGFWSHLKRGIKAIYIHVSKKHLNKYCKEYAFRYNTRYLNDYQRFSAWFDNCRCRLTYKSLIG